METLRLAAGFTGIAAVTLLLLAAQLHFDSAAFAAA